MDAAADRWGRGPPLCLVHCAAVAFADVARHHRGGRVDTVSRLAMKMKGTLFAAGLMSAALAPCADAQVLPCSQRMPLAWTLSFPRTSLSGWLRSLPAYRIWGTQNMAVQHEGSTNVLEVMYPKG